MTRLRIWTDPDACSGCKYCGMDMDMDPYCSHPNVLKKHPYGLVIRTAITSFCLDGEKLSLWEKRDPPAFSSV